MLDTYANLKTAVADWLNRQDLTSQIADYITLAEAHMNRELDCREMYARQTLTISGEFLSLPCDFAGVRSFRLNTNPVQRLEYVKPDAMDDIYDAAAISPGLPIYYTIDGDKFCFSRVPDSAYQARLRYRRRLCALSDATSCNWVLEKHPDAYLYGALLQAAPFLMDDDRLRTWGVLYKSTIDEINADDAKQNYGASLNMRGRRIG